MKVWLSFNNLNFFDRKTYFVCSCCLYMFLFCKLNFVNKWLESTISRSACQSGIKYLNNRKFAFFSVKTISAGKRNFSNKDCNWFLSLFHVVKPSVTQPENWVCLFLKKKTVDLTNRRELRTLTITFVKGLKSPSVHATFLGTQNIRTMHVLSRENQPFVKPVFKVARVLHRSCSQLSHTCPQRIINSCKAWNSPIVKIDKSLSLNWNELITVSMCSS